MHQTDAGVAQLAEQRFCKPRVVGSSPTIGSGNMGGCPSGQRGLAVNQVRNAAGVRIPLPPRVFTLCDRDAERYTPSEKLTWHSWSQARRQSDGEAAV